MRLPRGPSTSRLGGRLAGRDRASTMLRWWWMAPVLALMAGAALYSFCARPVDLLPKSRLDRAWTLEPRWDDPPSEGPGAPESQAPSARNAQMALYLDVSVPLGGFLAPPARQASSHGLREVFGALPGYLLATGGGTSSIDWRRVAEEVGPLAPLPRLEADLFQGRRTELSQAIAEILGRFREPEFQTAVLVTDLVATERDVLGAMGVANALADWSRSREVREGRAHLGLVGIRAPYYGVHVDGCSGAGGLGCRLSEVLQRWLPLARPAQAAFYVVVFSKRRDVVETLASDLETLARTYQLDTQLELLTAASAEHELPTVCEVFEREASVPPPAGEAKGRPNEWTLFFDPREMASCQRERYVDFRCDPSPLQPGLGPSPLERFGVREARTTWPAVEAGLAGRTVSLSLDCSNLLDGMPSDDLDVLLVLDSLPDSTPPDWSLWSTDSDQEEESLGKTLQLNEFVHQLRLTPDRWELESPGFLRSHGSREQPSASRLRPRP